MDIQKKSKI